MSQFRSAGRSRPRTRVAAPCPTPAPDPQEGISRGGSDERSAPYVHPHLAVGVDPAKGRQVTCTSPIKDGQVIMMDAPYALVPAVLVDEPPFHLCNSHECNRRIEPRAASVACPEGCVAEVLWCNEKCRSQDETRHRIECAWLKLYSTEIRANHGDSNFGLLWLIVRLFIVKHLPPSRLIFKRSNSRSQSKSDLSHFDIRGWDAVWNLEGTLDSFPADKIGQWRQYAESYFAKGPLARITNADEVVALICKVEINSFGLYPGVTGEYPLTSFVGRGDYYGGGIYPTAAMFNHACCPNVTHKLDSQGRRIFEAGRDIKPGEECCISYFDLTEFSNTEARQDEVARSWSFICNCQRCVDEGEFELPHYLKEMEFD